MNWIKRKLRDWVAPDYYYFRNRVHELNSEIVDLQLDISTLIQRKGTTKATEVEAKWTFIWDKHYAESFRLRNIKTNDHE